MDTDELKKAKSIDNFGQYANDHANEKINKLAQLDIVCEQNGNVISNKRNNKYTFNVKDPKLRLPYY